MEGGSTGNSRRKSYTAKFKLEVVEVAKEKGNREAGRLFNVGESSDYVHDDTLSEMEEEGMEEIPKEILNATDSFNVESDEEFLGFE